MMDDADNLNRQQLAPKLTIVNSVTSERERERERWRERERGRDFLLRKTHEKT